LLSLKSENKILIGIVAVFISVASFILLGFTGLRTILGIAVFFFWPFYMIFNNLNLREDEKIIFSFFAGITFLPSLVYWIGFIVPFRIGIIVVFAVLLAAAYALSKISKKKNI